ncbi:TRAP transporter small permease [Castellaniella sp.]|uniref:TRAP transporter small permease n=1 Tax=Castellaniella sp. TaxID=1955812 RepID=UPI00355FF5BE
MVTFFKTLDRYLIRGAMAAAISLLVLMTAVSFFQVITRFVFEQPSTWSEVTSRTLNIWMIYLGLIVACRYGLLMAVDTLISHLHGRARVVLLAVISIFSIALLLVVTWYGYEMALRVRFQALAGLRSPFSGKNISISWMYAALPVGALLSSVAVLAHLVEEIARFRSGAEAMVHSDRVDHIV